MGCTRSRNLTTEFFSKYLTFSAFSHDGTIVRYSDSESGQENYPEYPDTEAEVHDLSSSRMISRITGSCGIGVYMVFNGSGASPKGYLQGLKFCVAKNYKEVLRVLGVVSTLHTPWRNHPCAKRKRLLLSIIYAPQPFVNHFFHTVVKIQRLSHYNTWPPPMSMIDKIGEPCYHGPQPFLNCHRVAHCTDADQAAQLEHTHDNTVLNAVGHIVGGTITQ